MTGARPFLKGQWFLTVLLGISGLGAGAAGPALAAGGAAAGVSVRDARPGGPGRDKPPVRMLEATLSLGSGSPQESLGAAGSWQEVRAAIVAEFKPTAELITAEAKPVALAKSAGQLKPAGQSKPSAMAKSAGQSDPAALAKSSTMAKPVALAKAAGQSDPAALAPQLVPAAAMKSAAPDLVSAVTAPTGELDPVDQADAARQVYERPANIRTVELAATIEADGRLSSLTVLTPSGSSAFDDTAALAVRRGLRNRAGADPGSRVLVRLRLSAGRAITLPRVVPLREPPQPNARPQNPPGLVATGALQFDDTTGAVTADRPLSNRLNSQVELISVTSAPPPAAPAHPASSASAPAR